MGVMQVSLICTVLVSELAFFTKERDHEIVKMALWKLSAHRSIAGKKENWMLGIVRKSAKKENKNLHVPLCKSVASSLILIDVLVLLQQN